MASFIWPPQGSSGGGSGTVTSLSVVTANGLAGTVANPTTTPAITLSTTVTGILQGNGTSISAATTGNLTSTPTTNLVVTGGTGAVLGSGALLTLTGASLVEATSAVLTISGGANAVLGTGVSIQVNQSSTSVSGYLSSTDWNTFNGKQSSGNYITALTGDVTAAGPGSSAATIAAGAVTLGKMASLAANSIIGNNTGSGATPIALTVSQVNTLLGSLSNPMTTGGDIIYGGASGVPTRLANGSATQVLTSQGTTVAPHWATPTTGTVTSVTFTGDGTVLSSTPSSAVTTTGTVTASLKTQTQNTILAGPTTGSAATPTFRALVNLDTAPISSLDGSSGVAVHGVTTSSSASAGYVGEYVVSTFSAVAVPATGVYGDATSISLTAGDWDITVQFIYNSTAAVSQTLSGVSVTSGNSSTGLVTGDSQLANLGPTAGNGSSTTISAFRASLTGTTTYFAKMFAQYVAGSPTVAGRMSARRIR